MEGLFARFKAGIVWKRVVQSAVLLCLSVVAIFVSILLGAGAGGALLVALLALPPLGLGILGIRGSRHLARRLENVEVSAAGIRLPLGTRLLNGSSLIQTERIERLDLHDVPYDDVVEIFLKGQGRSTRIILEKAFIFDWTAFVDAIHRLGFVRGNVFGSGPQGVASLQHRGSRGARHVRSVVTASGLISVVVIAVALATQVEPLRALFASAVILTIVTAGLTSILRRIPTHVTLNEGTLRVRTPVRVYPFPILEWEILVGGESLILLGKDGAIRMFRFVDPRDLAEFARVHGPLSD